MIGALKALFESPSSDDPGDSEHRVRLAAAALLIETARADFTQSADEQAELEKLLCRSLELSPTEVAGLVADAQDRVDESTSLYEFTRVINDHCNADEKLRLVEAMWRVAYTDGRLDKYEEALIRRVAELTYVPHSDYIRSKLNAREAP
ncbi:MAG: TerB family tellurite resistance protein [Halioglobus sp.]